MTGELEQRLAEAEKRLRHVESISPRASLSGLRGRIAALRGDTKTAAFLFHRATESALAALRPRSNTLRPCFAANPPVPLAGLTGPFAERFPRDPKIQAVHAAALHKDERFPEAAKVLERALQLDEKIGQFLGDEGVKEILDGAHLTPRTVEGMKAMKAERYDPAAVAFRQVLVEEPRNFVAARLLARTIAISVASASPYSVELTSANAAREIGELSRQFPDDAEIQVALAVALNRSGQRIEAARALDRSERLGGRPDKFLGLDGIATIRDGAELEQNRRYWWTIALAIVGGAAAWISTMFVLGAALAIGIPRVPGSVDLSRYSQSRREVWLERFYLLVLSLGLLVFYASVPVVAVGLLAVTLAVFGLFLILRIIHYGVLQRGLWATWNVLRCAFIGPQARRAWYRGDRRGAPAAVRRLTRCRGTAKDPTG